MSREKGPQVSDALLGEMNRLLVGERNTGWLAEQIRTLKGDAAVKHESSYYAHVLARRFRPGPRELRGMCLVLGIDPVWAFEEAGYPQVGRMAGDDSVLPGLLAYLQGLSMDRQRALLAGLPLIVQLEQVWGAPRPVDSGASTRENPASAGLDGHEQEARHATPRNQRRGKATAGGSDSGDAALSSATDSLDASAGGR